MAVLMLARFKLGGEERGENWIGTEGIEWNGTENSGGGGRSGGYSASGCGGRGKSVDVSLEVLISGCSGGRNLAEIGVGGYNDSDGGGRGRYVVES
ncbi:hypothetical protein K7X08_002606 [Anisodus acutangulus]|uniref:Uncharacterized protein n=1 Tax=Anisodus acutangulus TaxID=402998 RepID=A0A9Q1R647_9SOLA|nr:hypothetical protein K7X08_002606 [Anisodus acutangulus]